MTECGPVVTEDLLILTGMCHIYSFNVFHISAVACGVSDI